MILKAFKGVLLMKKLLLALSIITSLLSNAFAIDLISLATNGKSNEKSLGVKTLNHQEMGEIIGGAYAQQVIRKQYGIVDNFGNNIYYTAYYEVKLTTGDSAYFNLGSDYYAAVATTYNFKTNKITSKVVKINKNNPSNVKTLDFQNNVIGRIKDYKAVENWIKQDKVNIKYFR